MALAAVVTLPSCLLELLYIVPSRKNHVVYKRHFDPFGLSVQKINILLLHNLVLYILYFILEHYFLNKIIIPWLIFDTLFGY